MRPNNAKFDQLFEELVPPQGACKTLAGELIRATNRLAYRFYNDGDVIGHGYGRYTCNQPARFIIQNISTAPQYFRLHDILNTMWGMWWDDEKYGELLHELVDKITEYIIVNKVELDTHHISEGVNDMLSAMYYDKEEDEERDDEEDY